MVVSTSYAVSGKKDSLREKVVSKSVLYFDRQGRTIKRLTYRSDSDGSLRDARDSYVYDKKGNLIQDTFYELDGSIGVRNNYRYNKFGQQILREYSLGKMQEKTITKSTYDRTKKIAVIEGHTTKGVFTEKSVISYNDKWQKVEITGYTKDGRLQIRTDMQYDENGNQILSNWYDSTNRLHEVVKDSFNSMNDKIKSEAYIIKRNDTVLIGTTRFEYRYDLRGNVIYEGLITNGRTTWITRNEFTY